jgi:K+-transporting ATPase A subunit
MAIAKKLHVAASTGSNKKMTNGNGTVALTRLVWWAIGIGAAVVVGAGAFFSTSYLGNMQAQITAGDVSRELRMERVNTLEGRISTLENTSAASLQAIKESLAKMEVWQEQVRNDIAELKARKP